MFNFFKNNFVGVVEIIFKYLLKFLEKYLLVHNKSDKMKIDEIYAKKHELLGMKAGLEIFAFDGLENETEIKAADAAIKDLNEQIKKIDDDDRKDSIKFYASAFCVICCCIIAIVLVFAVL